MKRLCEIVKECLIEGKDPHLQACSLGGQYAGHYLEMPTS